MVLGDIDNTGNPRDLVIAIGPVTKRAKIYRWVVIILTIFMTKDTTTLYNSLLTIKKFSALYNVAVGQLETHITTDVD